MRPDGKMKILSFRGRIPDIRNLHWAGKGRAARIPAMDPVMTEIVKLLPWMGGLIAAAAAVKMSR